MAKCHSEDLVLDSDLCRVPNSGELDGILDDEQGVSTGRLGKSNGNNRNQIGIEGIKKEVDQVSDTENTSTVEPSSISQLHPSSILDPLTCSFCHQGFSDKKDLTDHQEQNHVKKENGREAPFLHEQQENSTRNVGIPSASITSNVQSPWPNSKGLLLSADLKTSHEGSKDLCAIDVNSSSADTSDMFASTNQSKLQVHVGINKDISQTEKEQPESEKMVNTMVMVTSKDSSCSSSICEDDILHTDRCGSLNINTQLQGILPNGLGPPCQEQHLAVSHEKLVNFTATNNDKDYLESSGNDVTEKRVNQQNITTFNNLFHNPPQNDLSDLECIRSSVNVDFHSLFPSLIPADVTLVREMQKKTLQRHMHCAESNKKQYNTLLGNLPLKVAVPKKATANHTRNEIVTTSLPSNHSREGLSHLVGKKDNEGDVNHSKECQVPKLPDKSEVISTKDHLRKYPCYFCGQRFKRSSHRRDHERSHNINDQFKCSHCGKHFTRKRVWLNHEKLHAQRQIGKFKCRRCHLSFFTKEEKKEHVNSHLEVRKYKCNMCNKKYKCSSHLKDHVRTHSINSHFKCSVCDKFFTRKRDMIAHEKLHKDKVFQYKAPGRKTTFQKNEQKAERKYPCTYCGKCFKISSHCKEHEKCHDIESRFRCSYCQKGFSSKRSMLVHVMKHAAQGDVKVDEDTVDSNKKQNMTNVKRKNNQDPNILEDTKYMCSYCGKGYKFSSHCRDHERSHNINSQFRCSYCQKCFTKKRVMLIHEMKHAAKGDVKDDVAIDGKPTKCKAFQPKKPVPFRCWRCKINFQTRAEKKRHFEAHLVKRKYLCRFCGKQFKYCGHCKEHERSHNIGDKLKCLHCSKCFTSKRLLAAHVQYHIVTHMVNWLSGVEGNYNIENGNLKKQQELTLFVNNHILTDEKFPCRFCHKVYLQKFQLRAHEVIQHQYMRSCKLCGFSCVTSKQMTEHAKVHMSNVGGSSQSNGFVDQNLISQPVKNKSVFNSDFGDSSQHCGDKGYKMNSTMSDNIELKDGKAVHVESNRGGGIQSRELRSKCKNIVGDSEHDHESNDKTKEQTDKEIQSLFTDDKNMNAKCVGNNHNINKLSICEFCNRSFRTHMSLLDHQKKRHTSQTKPYMCSDCSQTFLTKEKRDIHLRQHLSERPFQCRFCPKRFKKAHHCREHELIHDIASQLKCIYCDKGFTCKRYLQKHLLGERSKKPFRCKDCFKIFSIRSCLVYHEKFCRSPINDSSTNKVNMSSTANEMQMKEVDVIVKKQNDHDSQTKDDSRIIMDQDKRELDNASGGKSKCQKLSSESDMFEGNFLKYLECMIDVYVKGSIETPNHDGSKQHSVNESKNEPNGKGKMFRCKFCAVVFESELIWVKHEFLHTPKECLSCWYCHASFQTMALKEEHETGHRQDSQLCQKCGTFFKSHHLWLNHSCQNPQADMEYKCEKCADMFAKPEDLLDHEKSHRGRRSFTCSYCKSKFVNSDSFQYHLQTVHGVMSSVDKTSFKTKYLSCKYCRKNFYSECSLEMHEKGHTGSKPYCCPYCTACFRTHSLLLEHEDTHASDRPFKCDTCGFRVKDRNKLSEHVIRHGESQYRCEHCTRQFTSECEFFKHEKSHPDVCRYMCKHCNESFACDVNRHYHTRYKHNETITCFLCGQELSSSHTFARHLISHKKKNHSIRKSHQVPNNADSITTDRNVPNLSSDEDVYSISPYKVLCSDTVHASVKVLQKNVDALCQGTLVKCSGADETIVNRSNVSTKVGNTTQKKKQVAGGDFTRKLRARYPTRNATIKSDICSSDPEIVEIFQCKYCAKSFVNKNRCTRHENLHVSDKTDLHTTEADTKTVTKTVAKVNTATKTKILQKRSGVLVACFKCEYCNKLFSSRLLLKRHQVRHVGQLAYQCRYCNMETFNTSTLRDIHEATHSKERPFQCQFCGRRFKRIWHKTEHERVHDQAMQFKCKECDHHFARLNELRKHEKKYHSEKAYTCQLCNASLSSYRNLLYHWKLKHSTEEPPWNKKQSPSRMKTNKTPLNRVMKDSKKKSVSKAKTASKKIVAKNECAAVNRDYTCPKCKRCFLNKYHLAEHIATHDVKQQHHCQLCKRHFVRLIDIWRHEQCHQGKRKHKCTYCTSYFFNKGSVKYHQKIEHGLKHNQVVITNDTFQKSEYPNQTVNDRKCKVCLKTFSSKNHMLEHQRLHDPTLMFHCEICGKHFTRLIRLWRHEGIHKGSIKRHRCTLCRARFYNKGSCDYHIRSHKVKLPPKKTLKHKVFTCSHCSKSFGNKVVAQRHEATCLRTKQLPHQCSDKECDEKFTTLTLMEKHYIAVHSSDRPYKCNYCSLRFKQHSHSKSHEQHHRPETMLYVCEICKERFGRPRALYRHEKTHQGLPIYKCSKCSMKCFNMISIMYHKLSIHGISYGQQGMFKLIKKQKTKFSHRPSVHKTKHKKNKSTVRNKQKKNISSIKKNVQSAPDVESKSTELIPTEKQKAVEVLEVSEVDIKEIETNSKKQCVPVEDVIKVIEDKVFICELCTEEFACERELRRHKRFHAVEIEAMHYLQQNVDTNEQNVSNHGSKQKNKMKKKPVIKKNENIRHGHGKPKRGITRQSNFKVKSKVLTRGNVIQRSKLLTSSKVIQKKTRRAAFRQGIKRRRNGEKTNISVKKNMQHVLKRLSWNTGVETTPVLVKSRFRLRNFQSETDGEKVSDKKTEEATQIEQTSEAGGEGKYCNQSHFNKCRLRQLRSANDQGIKNGHIINKVPSIGTKEKVPSIGTKKKVPSIDPKEKVPTNTTTKTTQCQTKSNFLSLLKETEAEREDGMAFVSRVLPVLYNGHCRSCIQCGKRFDTDEALAEHQKWHTCSKRIKCLECNTWCNNDKEYRVHWKEHALHRLLYCKHCGKDFPDKDLLWRHEKTHNRDSNGTGEGGSINQGNMEDKRFVCDMCSEAFVTEDELKVHQVSHTAPRAFVCEHCSMSFNQERQLRSHQTRHVGDLTSWQKSFGCPLCGGMFRSSEDLKAHEKTFHGSEDRFQCKYCEKSFAVEKNWRAHEEVHGVKKSKRRGRNR